MPRLVTWMEPLTVSNSEGQQMFNRHAGTTIILVMVFIVVGVLCGCNEGGRSQSPRWPIPRIAIIYATNSSTANVALLDLTSAERIEVARGNCAIVNLTPKVCLAKRVVITRSSDGRRVNVEALDVVQDAFPCFGNGCRSGSLKDMASYTWSCSSNDVIRINGTVRTVGDVVGEFSDIPPRQTAGHEGGVSREVPNTGIGKSTPK